MSPEEMEDYRRVLQSAGYDPDTGAEVGVNTPMQNPTQPDDAATAQGYSNIQPEPQPLNIRVPMPVRQRASDSDLESSLPPEPLHPTDNRSVYEKDWDEKHGNAPPVDRDWAERHGKPVRAASGATAGGGASQAYGASFQSAAPEFHDMPFPLVDPTEYVKYLAQAGWNPANIQKEVARYREWRATTEGRVAGLESEQTQTAQNQGGIDLQNAGEQRDIMGNLAPAMQANMQAQADAEADRQAAQKEAEQEYKGKLKQFDLEISDLHSTVINPDRYFDTHEGSRAVSAIAVGLGEVANQITGHGNAALKIVENAIDRDIDAQKSTANTKYMALGMRGNMLSRMHERFGDIDLAAHATKAAQAGALANYADYLGAAVGDSDAKAKYDKLAEQLRTMGVQAKQAFDLKLQANVDAKLQARIDAANWAASQANKQEIPEDYIWQPLSESDRDRAINTAVFDPDSGEYRDITGLASSKKGRDAIAEKLDITSTLLETIGQIQERNKEGSQWIGADPNKAANDILLRRFQTDYLAWVQGGRSLQTTKSEIENVAVPSGDLANTDILTGVANVASRIHVLKDIIGKDLQRNLRSVQRVPFQNTYNPDTGVMVESVGYRPDQLKMVRKAKASTGKGDNKSADVGSAPTETSNRAVRFTPGGRR